MLMLKKASLPSSAPHPHYVDHALGLQHLTLLTQPTSGPGIQEQNANIYYPGRRNHSGSKCVILSSTLEIFHQNNQALLGCWFLLVSMSLYR